MIIFIVFMPLHIFIFVLMSAFIFILCIEVIRSLNLYWIQKSLLFLKDLKNEKEFP
jgi:hypothetical protein